MTCDNLEIKHKPSVAPIDKIILRGDYGASIEVYEDSCNTRHVVDFRLKDPKDNPYICLDLEDAEKFAKAVLQLCNEIKARD